MTERASQDLGLEIKLDKSSPEPEKSPINSMLDGDEAVFLHRTLRSGHKVNYHGHIVVLGDVNPGAELIAGGNIIVWGRLRGVAHAGAGGDTALWYAPWIFLLLSCEFLIKSASLLLRKGKPRPEIAYLEDGQVTARDWAAG